MPPIVSVQKVSVCFPFEGFALEVGLAEGETVGVAVGMGIGTGEGVFVSPASSILNTSGVAVGREMSTVSGARFLPVANATMASAITMTVRTASAAICKGEKCFMFFLTFFLVCGATKANPLPFGAVFTPMLSDLN